jgi:hypothetical protein
MVISIGGMIVTREDRSSWRRTYSGATVPTTNPTRNVLGSNEYLHGDRPAVTRLSHGTDSTMEDRDWQDGGCKPAVETECGKRMSGFIS